MSPMHRHRFAAFVRRLGVNRTAEKLSIPRGLMRASRWDWQFVTVEVENRNNRTVRAD